MIEQGYVSALRQTLEMVVPRLEQMDERTAAHRPAPEKWSPKEIVGHLIDSACNNHRRFVVAQLSDDLVFEGYQQADWVVLQGHRLAPWQQLVALWALYNRHIIRVMTQASAEQRTRLRARHNLHVISTSGVAESEPGTLDHLMADYVKHLQSHVRQILPDAL